MNRVLAITLALGLGFIALPVVAEEAASEPTVTAQLIPGRVLTGSEVQVFVVVRNPTDTRVHFDLVIWHGGSGWGQRDRPVRATDNTFIYWSGLQQDGGFTVNNLSGGVTYYFKVRAGNGCTPGDYSNELSATPGGGVISGLAAGFSEGVLGTATPSANEKNMQEQKEQQTTKKVLGNEEKPNAEQGESFLASAKKYFPLIILLTFFILFFYWLLRMNKKRKF